MGILFDMAAFYRWLENANDRELQARHEALIALRGRFTEAKVQASATSYIMMIEEEMLARSLRP